MADLTRLTSHPKTEAEFREDFSKLHKEESLHKGRLDQTIFAMGDLLVRWQPDRATLSELAKEFGYKKATLEQRRDVALNIPESVRNPDLSYSAHVEALKIENVTVRNELIASSGGRSANLIRVAVYEKRLELGEIKRVEKPRGEVLKLADRLNWSGGFAISDGNTVMKFRGTLVDGQLQLIIDSTNPILGQPDITPATQGRKLIIDASTGETL